MPINFNTEPYNDDYNEDKKFYKILFRPSFSVQARELTQLQTILQKQISRLGDHMFKQGSMVIPGQIALDKEYNYIKLQPLYNALLIDSYLDEFIGKRVFNDIGVEAEVLAVSKTEGADAPTLFVRYVSSGTDNNSQKFADDEEIFTEDRAYTVFAQSLNSTGVGTAAIIKRGVYYINNNFVLTDDQTIILEKYSTQASYRVGLTLVEDTVTAEDDESLLDNAQSSYNFAAPGAHRHYIDLILSKLPLTSTADDNFIELMQVDNGVIKKHVTNTEYSVLADTLARRTFDESGDYTVTPFDIDLREHRNNDRGQWLENTAYLIGDVVTNAGLTYVAKNTGTSGSTTPVHTSGSAFDSQNGIEWQWEANPQYNRGVFSPEDGGDESKLAIGMSPGKAYVRGYEIEKISLEYVDVPKSRQFVESENLLVSATIGNYVLVSNVNNLPRMDTFTLVDLYDKAIATRGVANGTKIGTARVRGIEWHNGDIGTQAAQYKLFLFDVKLNSGYDFKRDVKSFYYDAAGGAARDFTADILPVLTKLIGSVTANNSTTLTGSGTSYLTDLSVGDYIKVGTDIRRVESISTQQALVLDAPVTVTGEVLFLVTTDVLEPENDGLIYPLPHYAIKSVRNSLGLNTTSYTVSERLTGGTDANGVITVTTGSGGTFASGAERDNYIIMDQGSGDILAPASETAIVPAGSSVDIDLGVENAGKECVVIATVNKFGSVGTEKQKTLTTSTLEISEAALVKAQTISLQKADIYRIISIKMKPGTFLSPGAEYSIDISDRYNIDNGQRATYYDVGSLSLKPSFTEPSAPIQIIFEYFTHSANGDYFTVNSYPANVEYKYIPSYGTVSLRDVIDFRPRIDDSGLTFSGTGASTTLMPKRGIDIRTDLSYYLARKDKIALDSDGKFFLTSGTPSLAPSEPNDPTLSMVICKLELEPYTFGANSSSVVINKIDNKRYTMRDIGKLEKRIDNLEYYTSLSLLEQETKSLDIQDATGLDRFKNGFVVDNFSGHGIGDVFSPDYMCAVDPENGELRPFYNMQNVNLIEKNTNDGQRNASNYKVYGDVITLPVLEHIPLVKQEFASRTEFVNPYAIFTFLGDIKLQPSSDDWFETDRRPDLIKNEEGNYNTVAALAEKAGVLGTIWNAWQTQWTGTQFQTGGTQTVGGYIQLGQVTFDNINRQFGNAQVRDTIAWQIATGQRPTVGARYITLQSWAALSGQSRTGVKTSIVTKVDTRVVEDRVLSSAVIPFMRSRNILVKVKGLKPNTTFFPFFDDVSVYDDCTSPYIINYTPLTGVIDDERNVGGAAEDSTRRIAGDSQVCLNTGDVIRGTTSGATAVVVRRFDEIQAGNSGGITYVTPGYRLDVFNVKGTFTAGETFVGSVSGATGRFNSGRVLVGGKGFITNQNGELNMLFNIPNKPSKMFKTGSKEFKLVDVNSATAPFNSRARTNFSANGILETRQQTVVATRNAEIVKEQVNEARVIQVSNQRIVQDTGWYDPLAQTFMVSSKGGAFLSKVDIFFAAKDPSVPVRMEVREVVNGYPGKRILPFSVVTLNPSKVNLASTTVSVDGVSWPNFNTPTTFEFPSPVYVQDGTEYCIVLLSDSNLYKVWISNMGDRIPGSTRTISEQPYAGVLFKSQNASTWTADQNQDLKFTLYRAKFNTSVVGNVQFVNDLLPLQTLDTDPFETTAGSNKVRVWHSNHGMPSGSKVEYTDLLETNITGTSGTGTISVSANSSTVIGTGTKFIEELGELTTGAGTTLYTEAGVKIGNISQVLNDTTLQLTLPRTTALSAGTKFKIVNAFNGVPAEQIYTTHTISDVDLDSYVLTVTSNARYNGYSGGGSIRSTRNIAYDTIQPQIQFQSFSDTILNTTIKTTSGKSVDGSETAYVLDNSFAGCLANQNNNFYAPKLVSSKLNETQFINGNKSLTISCDIASSNDALSPIIDTHRLSAALVSNKVNNPIEETTNVGGLDINQIFGGLTGDFSFSGNSIITTSEPIKASINGVRPGVYITISGATSDENNGTFLVQSTTNTDTEGSITFVGADFVTENALSTTLVFARKLFFDEITPLGSSTFSKYVSKNINLSNPSTFLRIRMAASVPDDADLEVYYRVSPVGSINALQFTNWTKADSDLPLKKVQLGENNFYETDYSIDELPQFDALSVKLVMKSKNSCAIPRIRDLRIIACA
jgi:hypothetical protein